LGTLRNGPLCGLRYETGLTDRELNLIALMMPPAAKTGLPGRWSLREIMNAIFYVMPRYRLAASAAGLPAQKHGVPMFACSRRSTTGS
jgi:transposase